MFRLLLCASLGLAGLTAQTIRAEEMGAVYELRTYTTLEGRLPALESRFRDHTMGLFEEHGISNVGYWIPTDRPNTLIYLIVHENQQSIASNWKAFGSDPRWQEVAKASVKDGPILVKGGIVSQLMTATDFSPMK